MDSTLPHLKDSGERVGNTSEILIRIDDEVTDAV
jgi:hypothetical protein